MCTPVWPLSLDRVSVLSCVLRRCSSYSVQWFGGFAASSMTGKLLILFVILDVPFVNSVVVVGLLFWGFSVLLWGS